MKRLLFVLNRHGTLLKILIAAAVVIAIALAGGAPNFYDP